MPALRRNLIANFVGQGWSAILGVIFIPVYLKLLGVEAFGLIGFYTTLVSLFQVFDFGLSPTLNREIARRRALSAGAPELRSLVKSFEIVYVLLSASIGLSIIASAGLLTRHWIKASSLPSTTVLHAVQILGVVVAVQWAQTLYQAGLMGLERQVALNVVKVGAGTFSTVGAVLLLGFISRTVVAFFLWQLGIATISLIATRSLLWVRLPASETRARVDFHFVGELKKFFLGMGCLTVTGIAVTQYDKIGLSGLLPLKQYGYYMLAAVWAAGIVLLSAPVFNVVFPRFSSLIAKGDSKEVSALYHSATRWLAALVLPVASTIVLFSRWILFFWTQDRETASAVSPILQLLAAGMAFHAILHIPYALQLADGWIGLALKLNVVTLIVAIPAMVQLVRQFGAVGAAWLWVAVSVVGLVVSVTLMHRRLLRGEALQWFLRDLAPPLLLSTVIAWAFFAIDPTRGGSLSKLAWIGAALGTNVLACALLSRLLERS